LRAAEKIQNLFPLLTLKNRVSLQTRCAVRCHPRSAGHKGRGTVRRANGRGEACLALVPDDRRRARGEANAMDHDRFNLWVLCALWRSNRDPARSHANALQFHVFTFHVFPLRRRTHRDRSGPLRDPLWTRFFITFLPRHRHNPSPFSPFRKSPSRVLFFLSRAPIISAPTSSPASNASICNTIKKRFRAKPPVSPPLTPISSAQLLHARFPSACRSDAQRTHHLRPAAFICGSNCPAADLQNEPKHCAAEHVG
jgi:hypothetical protein